MFLCVTVIPEGTPRRQAWSTVSFPKPTLPECSKQGTQRAKLRARPWLVFS